MKKFLLTLACVLVSLSGMAQESEDQLINGVWYLLNVTYKQGVPHYIASVDSNPNTDDDDNPLTKYTGNVVIPDTVEYSGNKYAVIGINRYAFYDCDGLTSVKLPDGITEIGNGAFQSCTKLTSITFPTQLAKIGDYAFNESGLTAIVVNDSCKVIYGSAFADCPNLKSVTLGKKMAYIGSNAFTGSPLTSLDIWSDCTNGAPYMVGAFDESLYETLPVRVKKGTLDNYYYKDANTGDYESDWHNFKNITEAEFTSIENVMTSTSIAEKWYSIGGLRLPHPQPGLNILKVNGKTFKVIKRQ